MARAPALSVSQASAGQVYVRTAETTSDPTEPCSARRHSAGVSRREMSVHRRPGMPMITTGTPPGRPGPRPACGPLIAADAAGAARLACAVSATATASDASSARAAGPAENGFTSLPYPPAPPAGRWPPGG
jgi:hypothetical protein